MDRYFFDKRIVKKTLLRFGVLFLLMFPILIVLNSALTNALGNTGIIILDIIILLIAVIAMEFSVKKIQINRLRETEEGVVVSTPKTTIKADDKSKNKKSNKSEKVVVVKTDKANKKK